MGRIWISGFQLQLGANLFCKVHFDPLSRHPREEEAEQSRESDTNLLVSCDPTTNLCWLLFWVIWVKSREGGRTADCNRPGRREGEGTDRWTYNAKCGVVSLPPLFLQFYIKSMSLYRGRFPTAAYLASPWSFGFGGGVSFFFVYHNQS